MQSLVITRVVFGLLAIPVAIIGGAMLALAMTFYLFTVSPPLALIPLGVGVLGVIVLFRMEQARIARESLPPDDR